MSQQTLKLALFASLLTFCVGSDVNLKYYKGEGCKGGTVLDIDYPDCVSQIGIKLTCTKSNIFLSDCTTSENYYGSISTGCFDFCKYLREYLPDFDTSTLYYCSFSFNCKNPSKITLPALPEGCSNPTGDCNFYPNCLNKAVSCSVSDYALGFGYHYCNKYVQQLSLFSEKGQSWVNAVKLCLQKELVPLFDDNKRASSTCQDVKNEAFDSHVDCYVQPSSTSSICDLTAKDIYHVFSITIGASVKETSEFSRQVFNTAKKFWESCAQPAISQLRIKFSAIAKDLDLTVEKLEEYINRILVKHGITNGDTVIYYYYLVNSAVDGNYNAFIPGSKRGSEKISAFEFYNLAMEKMEMSPTFKRDSTTTVDEEFGLSIMTTDSTKTETINAAINEINSDVVKEVPTVDVRSSRVCSKECEKPNSSSLLNPMFFLSILSIILACFF